jgi:glutamate dehydrogenase (NAD(P)+)
VTEELERVMRRAYASVREVAREKKLDLRTAAFLLAVRRVGQAALSRRGIRESIDLG